MTPDEAIATARACETDDEIYYSGAVVTAALALADEVERLRAEVADLKTAVVAARMVDFTRAAEKT